MTPRSIRPQLLTMLAASFILSVPVAAQEIPLFTWSGRVDRRVELTVQGTTATAAASRGQEYRGRFRVANALPQQEGSVRVVVVGGRGDAAVIEQPTEANGYRTVVRVMDRSSGADRYQLSAFYTPADDARDPRRGGRGRFGGRNSTQAPAVLHWTGEVDADAEIRWQGTNVTQRAVNANALRGVRTSVGALGRSTDRNRTQGGAPTVTVQAGRGSVTITEQPSESNNYTTVVRISDPQSGYGRYTFDVTRP